MKYLMSALGALFFCVGASASTALPEEVAPLSTEWAKIKYQLPAGERVSAFQHLAEQASQVSAENPGKAEPLVWEAIILASMAGEKGGLGALSLVKKAKALLEQAEAIDADTLDGSVYTSLGSLYYQVPGWPLGFGDDEKAREYLQKALAVNPSGIDANFFYGDYLLENKDYKGAIAAFERALAAPPRAGRPLADAGRRKEIETALNKAKDKLNDHGLW